MADKLYILPPALLARIQQAKADMLSIADYGGSQSECERLAHELRECQIELRRLKEYKLN